jgi:hypothetical protein
MKNPVYTKRACTHVINLLSPKRALPNILTGKQNHPIQMFLPTHMSERAIPTASNNMILCNAHPFLFLSCSARNQHSHHITVTPELETGNFSFPFLLKNQHAHHSYLPALP